MDNKPKRGRPLSVNIKNISHEEYNNYCNPNDYTLINYKLNLCSLCLLNSISLKK